MMHRHGKSDSAIVAKKLANKVGQPVAERVERRVEAEGNADQQNTRRAQDRISVSHALERIRQAARAREKEQFTALLHHISIESLRLAYFELKRKAAPGVDGLTWSDYGAGLEGNLASLHDRVHRERPGRYRRDDGTSRSRTDGSDRWQSLRWKTKSSSVRSWRC